MAKSAATGDSVIATARLDLIEASAATVRAALDNPDDLGALLRAHVPTSWPPVLLDEDALQSTLRWTQEPANDPAFGMYWMVLRKSESDEPRAESREPRAEGAVLIGVAGFKGMPAEGTVEIGYGVVADYQRRGFATETVRAFLTHAFAHPNVSRVIAETLPGLVASIGVLEKCGFHLIGDGSEPGVIRYET